MNLTQQFLLTLTLPAAFLVLALVTWRGDQRLAAARRYWVLALLTAAVWASSVLSFYGGAGLRQEVAVGWRVIGRHALSLFSVATLLTTIVLLEVPRRQRRLLLALSAFFWLAAAALDPLIWNDNIPPFSLGGRQVGHFAVWSGMWGTAWLLPLLAAWLLAQQATRQRPHSLSRNRISFWLLALTIFILSGGLALIQQQEQPIWQELGALGQILAATVATATLSRSDLPDLRLTVRRLAAELFTALFTFALAVAALLFLARRLPQRTDVATNLDLIFAAAGFSLLLMVISYAPRYLMRWVSFAGGKRYKERLSEEPALASSLLDLRKLAALLLRLTERNLGVEEAVLFSSEEETAGNFLLRPLATLPGTELEEPIFLPEGSSASRQLRRRWAVAFTSLPPPQLAALADEAARAIMPAEWLYMPLQVGGQPVGVMALGKKQTGASYTPKDLAWLQDIASQMAPLLLQASSLQNIVEVNEHLFRQTHTLVQDKRYLQELVALYQQCNQLVSAELRQPLDRGRVEIQRLQHEQNGDADLAALQEQLGELWSRLNHLILVAHRIQRQSDFTFASVHMDEVCNRARRNLMPMAEARQVRVEVHSMPNLPPITGDAQQLTEAVQNLLHNAIKFNKIGGEVKVECIPAGDELAVHVKDTGVGLPDSRLETIWRRQAGRLGERQEGGAGLGLLLTRFIVQAHGGRVSVSSDYGSGSTFSIYVPMNLQATAAAP